MSNLKIWTPVGRMVQGNPFEAQTKDMQGNPLISKTTGQPRVQYFCAIAIPKTDPAWNDFWGQVYNVGVQSWPGGEYNNPDFAWKMSDGDKQADKEGFANHWVIKLSSGFPITIIDKVGAQVVDQTALKRGDYIRADIVVTSNKSTSKPGIFVNPKAVQICGYGEAIQTGPDYVALAAANPFTLPPGASPTPLAPTMQPMQQPGMQQPMQQPGMQQPGMQQPGMQQPGMPPAPGGMPPQNPAVVPPQAAQQPQGDFLNPPGGMPPAPGGMPPAPGGMPPAPGGMPQQQAAVPQPPAPGMPFGYQLSHLAGGATYEQLIAQGWTNESLVAQGMMTMVNDVPF